LKQATEVIEMQTGRTFNYIFEQEGEYNVILNLVSSANLLDSTVKFLVGDAYLMPSVQDTEQDSGDVTELPKFQAVLETLPLIQEDGKIYFETDAGTVTFLAASSL
jgi:hypothetical protein